MHESLQEFISSHGAALRVDRQAGVIRGVKILGLASRNGRRYLAEALRGAVGLYEGAKVNINHPKGSPLAPRDYQERIGVLRRVEFRDTSTEAGGLFGDLHYNPRHLLAEQLAWDAENTPENVGLSHNVLALVGRQGDETVVESISKVQGVDLVADPATTRGLFEHNEGAAQQRGQWLAELSCDDLQTQRADLVAALRERLQLENAALRLQLDAMTAAQAIVERRELLRRVLAEQHLPDPTLLSSTNGVITEQFVEAAMLASDEAALRRMVQERVDLIRAAANGGASAGRALCREQSSEFALSCADAHSFARAIRG